MFGDSRWLKYREALNEAYVQAMEADSSIFIFGAGADDSRGIFGTTSGAIERFGRARVFDVPNCENAVMGVALGAAAMGKRPVIVHARNDFMLLAFDQLLNLGAKWRYMYGGKTRVPVVIRAIVGRGWGQGATHSQSLHSVLAHFPGLYVTTPAFPADAKGITIAALNAGSPVVILENRACYELEGDVPSHPYEVPLGKGRIVREGQDVTIVGASLMAYEALRASDILSEHGISAEVVDPRSIRPLDAEIIVSSVRKTGHLVVADTSWALYGFAAEVAAVAAEKAWSYLKAPVRRVTAADCPAPVSKPLEDAFHPTPQTIATACLAVLDREEEASDRMEDVQAQFMGPY